MSMTSFRAQVCLEMCFFTEIMKIKLIGILQNMAWYRMQMKNIKYVINQVFSVIYII